MRLFTLMGFQHIVLYLFPTLVFIIIFGTGLGFIHFRSKNTEARKREIHHRYPENIEGGNAPFPLAMTLIMAGTVAWMLCYILGIGLLGVRI